MMRGARAALLVLALLVSAPAFAQADWQPSDGDRLDFDVFRDGSKFGKHIVVFHKTGDALTVDSDIDLKVAVGPLTLFQYIHDVTEKYSAGNLLSVASKTKKDGKWKTLAAEAVTGGMKVAGAAFKGVQPGVLIPSTHWNVEEMKQAAMFSTETGAMLPMTVTDMGIEKVKTGQGMIDARRYVVKSELTASFWYDASGRWVKCAFNAQGSKIEYVLRVVPG
ncbi:MAG TPA: DUF6134 family protein [Hyphomonadaceae bacterium]|jgi:hypothetical protein|nr:DUF6134 family protein [Hyphomonadaceae bacterium]